MNNRFQGTMALLGLFLRPSKNRAQTVYDLLSTHNNIGQNSLYLNLGYWKDAHHYDGACQALAEKLAQVAGLGAEDKVLDVGFGFADQDIFWLKRYNPRQIVGLNITASQIDVARRRVREAGADGSIILREGSATRMPFEAGSFDKVLALETAFHYDTREDFFHEAFRVLRPQGCLALADILPMNSAQGLKDRLGRYLGRCLWQIPKANMYPLEEYRSRLSRAGFINIETRSIRELVYPPFARYARGRLQEPDVIRRMHPMIRMLWAASLNDMEHGQLLDYVLVTANKAGERR